MDKQHIEDAVSVFSLSLAAVACSILIYFSRDPSITGYVVGETTTFNVTWIIILGIVSMLSLFMGLAFGVHKLNQQVDNHKRAIVGNSSLEDYVSKARKSGFSNDQIIAKLVDTGWSKAEIKKYLNNELHK